LRLVERLLPPERLPERDDPVFLELDDRDREELAREPLDRDRMDVEPERLDFDRDVEREPLERDRDDVVRDPLERFAPEREPPRPDPERVDDLRVVERLVVDRLVVDLVAVPAPPEVDPPAAAVDAGGGGGVAGGALAAAVRVAAPDTATSGAQPSSASAMSAPTVMAIAAARPRKMPTFSVGDPATIRQRIRRTASTPSRAVTVPRRTGKFTRCPAAARQIKAMPDTPDRMIRNPGRSVSASQPLIPGCDSERSPGVPVSSAPPLNQSKNRNTNRAMPPIPATISPVRTRDESKSLTPVDGCGTARQARPANGTRTDSTTASGHQA
jgi:hypothetical protein